MTTSSQISTLPQPDAITIERPEGMSEGRWTALGQQAHLMLTGHMPWCNDHESDGGGEGWCVYRENNRDVCEVVLTNGTLDGRTEVALEIKADTDGLSLREARVIAFMLDHAAEVGGLWNTGLEA